MCARTQVVKRAHTEKLGAHSNVPFENAFAHYYFIHVTLNSIQVKCCTKEILCAHRLKKIRGNIAYRPQNPGPSLCLCLWQPCSDLLLTNPFKAAPLNKLVPFA